MKRVVIIGTTGSGKTTLGKIISDKLAIPQVELDALSWLPNWQIKPTEQLRLDAAKALSGDAWVVDGNYSKLRDITWERGDTLIWLDYPFPLVIWRLFKRGLKRSLSREDLWGTGNRETLRGQFLSRDSLFLYAWKTHFPRRKTYPEAIKQYPHLAVYHLKSPRETAKWIGENL